MRWSTRESSSSGDNDNPVHAASHDTDSSCPPEVIPFCSMKHITHDVSNKTTFQDVSPCSDLDLTHSRENTACVLRSSKQGLEDALCGTQRCVCVCVCVCV